MTVAAIPADGAPGFEALARLRLPLDLRLRPEQFALVCSENPDAMLDSLLLAS
jgi:hypothetical protein